MGREAGGSGIEDIIVDAPSRNSSTYAPALLEQDRLDALRFKGPTTREPREARTDNSNSHVDSLRMCELNVLFSKPV